MIGKDIILKIIHTSDVHIDSPLTTRLPAGKVRERRAELSLGFKRLIGEANRLGAEAVLIAGDLFDTERISKRTLASVIEAIGASSGITFYYLEGNHEKNAIRESGIPLPHNLKLFEENWTYFEAEGINIVGRCSIAKEMFESLEMSAEATNIVVQITYTSDNGDGVYGFEFAKDAYGNWEILQKGEHVTINNLLK